MSDLKEKFAFEVEGVEYLSENKEMSGREVRSYSGHNPAADWCLIQINDGYTSSVGLEASVKLGGGAKPNFRTMKSDRVFEFTVEDLGWEWGFPTIAEADVRAYGKIPDDHEIVVEVIGQEEIVVPRGGTIDLAGPKIERIYTRESHLPNKLHVIFVINGEPTPVEGKPAEQLVKLLEKALKESENTGQPVDAWQVTDEPGNVLDVSKTLAELDIKNGATLLASLKAGAAG
ncbi:DUF2604 domain-containing protein [Bradyrhizobium yuanmingense]|uniref:DUF2604 domain-containing protein n=1 Tax=Bradyrhizobium yuanmingense TaxID=108015 RepID=UPI0021A8D604|nr:DUF2604 domain-containing protein [Bradyrhizobium sp. CB1024]UWU82989.1 DUF2604 domain-containing protein [Bradyrhizobium sp. CB1024]